MQQKNRKKQTELFLIGVYFIFICISFIKGFKPGKEIGYNFASFSIEMLKLLPCAFILIGLFEVWVKKESVERHLGQESGVMGYIWSILLAATTVGGLYVAFPIAYSLAKKGAGLSIVFCYLSASAICRIPMTIFEASFLGIKFSIIRLVVSIPLVILASMWMGEHFKKRNYQVPAGK